MDKLIVIYRNRKAGDVFGLHYDASGYALLKDGEVVARYEILFSIFART